MREYFEDLLQEKIINFDSLSGGTINNNFKLITEKDYYFLKLNENLNKDYFEKEAKGLNLLSSTASIKVPQVISFSSNDSPCGFLLLEYLPPGKVDSQSLAKDLVQLHQNTNDYYGLDYDNYIGSSPQSNQQHQTWADFFFYERLLFQVKLGFENKWISSEQLIGVEESKSVVDDLLGFDTKPSLLHGDLWSGNIYWSSAGPAIIDPAVYYGCFEADLAMTEMFSRLPESFYQEYFSEIGSTSYQEYSSRKDFYNLYHLLNHGNIFGGGYRQKGLYSLKKFKLL